MAEVVKYDEKKATEEKLEQAEAQVVADEKEAYLAALKKDHRFQQFVVRDIIKVELDRLGSLDTIPIGDDFKKMGELVVINAAARKTLQAILTRVL